MADLGGIFIDIFTRLNKPSAERVFKDVVNTAKEAGKEASAGFTKDFNLDGAAKQFEKISAAADSAYRDMQNGLAGLQYQEAKINSLRAQNYKYTSAAMIDAQREFDAALMHSQKLIEASTAAAARQRDALMGSLPRGRGRGDTVIEGREGSAGEGRGESGGENRRTTEPSSRGERDRYGLGENGGDEFPTVVGWEKKEQGESEGRKFTGGVGEHLGAEHIRHHLDRGVKAAGHFAGLGSVLASAGFIGYGVKESAQIQQSLNVLASQQHESKANIGLITQAVWNQAEQTGIHANDIAKLYDLAESAVNPKTGGYYRGNQSIDLVDTALKLAKVSNIDPNEALKGLTTSSYDYKIGPEGMSGLAGLISQAKAGFKGNVGDLFESLHTIEPIADIAGIKPAEILSALDVESQTGQSAQQSAQSTGNIIKSLARPNSVVSAALQQIGLDPQNMSVYLNQNGIGGSLGQVLQAISTKTVGPNGSVVLGAMANKPLMAQQQGEIYNQLSPAMQKYIDSPEFQKSLVSGFKARNLLLKAGATGSLTKSDEPLMETWLNDQKKMMGASDVLKRNQPEQESLLAAFTQAFGTKDAALSAIMLGGSPEALKTFNNRTGQLQGAQNNPNAFEESFKQAMAPDIEKWHQFGQALGKFSARIGNDALPILNDIIHGLKGFMDFLNRNKAAEDAFVVALTGAATAFLAFKLKIPQMGKWLWQNFKPNAIGGYGPIKDLNQGGGAASSGAESEAAGTLQTAAGTLQEGATPFAEGAVPFSEGSTVFSEAAGVFSEATSVFSSATPAFETGASALEPAASTMSEAAGALNTAAEGLSTSATQLDAAATAEDTAAGAIDTAAGGMSDRIAAGVGPAIAAMVGSQLAKDGANRVNQLTNSKAGTGFINNPFLSQGPFGIAQSAVKAEYDAIFGGPNKPPGKARGGIIGYKKGTHKVADPYSQPLLGVPDGKKDTVLGMLPDGSPVGLRGKEGILTPEAVDKIGGKAGLDALNNGEDNPWADPFKVGTKFYGSFAKGVAKYSPWGKYLVATSQTLDALEQEHEKTTKIHETGSTRGKGGKMALYQRLLQQEISEGAWPMTSEDHPRGKAGIVNAVKQAYIESGFPPDQFKDIEHIIGKESSWNPTARNASGAFGLGQFLGHQNDKYGAMGAYSGDPYKQAQAMMAYVGDRYGSPAAAWAHWRANNSYAKGGIVGFSRGGIPTAGGQWHDEGTDQPDYRGHRAYGYPDGATNYVPNLEAWQALAIDPSSPYGAGGRSPFRGFSGGSDDDPLHWGFGSWQDFFRDGPNDDKWANPGGAGIYNRDPKIRQWQEPYWSNDGDGPTYNLPGGGFGIYKNRVLGAANGGIIGYSNGGIVGFAGGGDLSSIAPMDTPGTPPAGAGGPNPALPPVTGQPGPKLGAGPQKPGQPVSDLLAGKNPQFQPGSKKAGPVAQKGSKQPPGGPTVKIQPDKPGANPAFTNIYDKPGSASSPDQDRNVKANPSRQGGQNNTSKGFGVGGGILGAAESAASTAANVFAPGSGQGAQMAFALANRAVGYAGQLVGIGIEGLMETFLPNDSSLGDPTNNLFGKMAMGIAGAHKSPANSAGKSGMQLNPKADLDAGASAGKQVMPAVHINGDVHNHGQQDWNGLSKAIGHATFGMDIHAVPGAQG